MEKHAGELQKDKVISIEEYLRKRKRIREEKRATGKARGISDEPKGTRALVLAELYM